MDKSRIEGMLYRTSDAPTVREGADGNTVLALSFSSETPYTRSSWFDEPWVEILGHKSSEVDLSRLNAGAPVLANHDRGATASTSPMASIGVVDKAWIEDGVGRAEIRLSRRPEIAGLLQDIADGIVRNVSVGYQINERTLLRSHSDAPDEYRVTSWTPMEISLVDLPADATIGIGRSQNFEVVQLPDSGDTQRKESTMDNKEQDQLNLDVIRREATAAERARVTEINEAVRGLRLDQSFADELIAKDTSADEARRLAIAKAAERSNDTIKPPMGHIEMLTLVDEVETRRAGVEEALLHRYNPAQHKLSDNGKRFSGLSLIEIGRELLTQRGVDIRGMSRDQIATRAMLTTGDFPYILANVANKTLRQAYEAAPQTFKPFTRMVTAPDFKTIARTALGDSPTLEKVNEHGEYKYGSVSEARETYAIASYGKIVALTRQTLINDDLSAFTRLPEMFGRAAADLESDTVWGIITANAALADSIALFHASHGNLPTGAAISVAQLGVCRAAMRVQTGLDGRKINVTPRYLLVPAALETIAQQFTSQAYAASASSSINPFAGALQVLAEPRLDTASTTAWYMAADPAQIDTIEYAYLEGNQGVYLETKDGWEIDGVEFKARLDFGAKAIDFRGLVKGN
ncbi:prohead protease/major capsid protein fusion protein [Dokdonella sp.]|uniref:prohead protease/major capsid protein fusion protein n=1 Tax=Dokdonella sp. TaxID=2291710 RepID=UPI002DD68FAF|nr:prohead protease/major capsid protein fusion protein [Dokdonella sp.]